MTLLALYAGCLLLGGILIGASMLGAGKDGEVGGDGDVGGDVGGDGEIAGDGDLDHDLAHDHDHDHDLAHDHDHAAHAVEPVHSPAAGALVATLLSLRFWTFSLAAFGMTGLLLTLIGVTTLVGLLLAVGTGVTVGAGVTTLLRTVSRDTVSSALDARSLRGRDAEVVLTIGPGKLGKIRLSHNGQLIELPATTREERLLERAERVLVVDVAGGQATVTSLTPDRRTPTSLPLHS